MTASEFLLATRAFQDKEKLREKDWISLISRFPYASSLYVFRALAAQAGQDDYDEILHQAAARTLSRSRLQLLVEGVPELEPVWMEIAPEKKPDVAEPYPDTISAFTEEAEALHPAPGFKPQVEFGFSFVRVKKKKNESAESILPAATKQKGKTTRQQDIMDKFIHEEPLLQPKLDFGSPKKLPDLAKKSGRLQEEIVSESMAMIYIRQKKFEQAITTLHKLSLKFPEKSAYFAALIKNLENQKPT